MIESDLDRRALQKKRERLEDRAWHESRNPSLPSMDIHDNGIQEQLLVLCDGRPRIPALLVLLFIMIRGYLGGVKNKKVAMIMSESKSLEIVLEQMGYKMPGASTIIDNINAVSIKTLEAIHDYQIEVAIEEELDDFKDLTFDSTSVEADSIWPTDSGLISNLICRVIRFFEFLANKHGVNVRMKDILNDFVKEIKRLHTSIQFSVGKKDSAKKRKKLYRELYKIAKKSMKHLLDAQKQAEIKISTMDVPPSRSGILKRTLEWIDVDLNNLYIVISQSSDRINRDKQTPSKEKFLSLSDEDAAIIAKGQRQPTLGYKPQIGRSKNGFIVSMAVPEGNANDSAEMRPIVDMAIERTGIVPRSISFDDGYTNTPVRLSYIKDGIGIVSFSGSKGKKTIPEDEYNSHDYIVARNNRSAVESLMYTLKHNEGFGRVMRRGIEQVRNELLEKVIVYNFFRIIQQRSEKKDDRKKTA